MPNSETSHQRRHDVHFYVAGSFPAVAIAEHLDAGVRAGAGVVVIATRAHRESLERLVDRDAVARGQALFFDADEILARLTPLVFEGEFETHVAEKVRALAGRFGRVRAFGEMVDVLWRRGDVAAALRLEAAWSRLVANAPLDLLCAYSVDAAAGSACADFHAVCAAHDAVHDQSGAFIAEQFFTEVTQLLSAAHDHQVTLDRIAQLVVGSRGCADVCTIDVLDESERLFDCVAAAWRGSDASDPLLAKLRRKHPARKADESELIVHVDDSALEAIATDVAHLEALRALRPRSIIRAPLVIRNTVVGALTMLSCDRAFASRDAWIAKRIASAAAVAIENARLFRAESSARRRLTQLNERLSLLVRIGEALAQTDAANAALGTLAKVLVPAFADCVAIYSIDGEARELVAVEHRDPARIELAREVALALGAAKPAIDLERWDGAIRNEHVELGEDHRAALERLGVRSWLAVPARTAHALVAVVFFASTPTVHFDDADCRFAEEIARRAVAAVERASLFESARESARRAEDANRLKDEFLATVSHELRTPLSAISGWIKLLRSGTLPSDKHGHALEVIERNARTQEKLVADLLDVSRVMSGGLRLDVEPIEMTKVIAMAVDAVKPSAESKGVQLVIRTIDDRDGVVMGDTERLQQIAWNLLANAVKFTPKGGRVEVELGAESPNVVLTVKDDGAGIRPEFVHHVFEAFRQADTGFTRSHGGLGLGLTIARTIVEMHGGTIEARSEGVGRGATFAVTLPAAHARSDSMPRVPTLVKAAPAARRRDLEDVRVLVLEDEPDSRELLLALFDRCGAKTYGAASVAEALEKLRHGAPRLIVSDLGLPGEDGLSFIRKVRQAGGARIAAIALTAFVRSHDRVRALEAGFDAHVAKPVEPDKLVSMAVTLLRATQQGPRAAAT